MCNVLVHRKWEKNIAKMLAQIHWVSIQWVYLLFPPNIVYDLWDSFLSMSRKAKTKSDKINIHLHALWYWFSLSFAPNQIVNKVKWQTLTKRERKKTTRKRTTNKGNFFPCISLISQLHHAKKMCKKFKLLCVSLRNGNGTSWQNWVTRIKQNRRKKGARKTQKELTRCYAWYFSNRTKRTLAGIASFTFLGNSCLIFANWYLAHCIQTV